MPEEKNEEMPVESTPETSSGGTNKNVVIAGLVALLIGFPVGYVVGGQLESSDDSDDTATTDTHSHSDDESHSSHSHSDKFEIPEGSPVPGVELMVTEDEKSGWNVTLMLENFTFTPENVNGEHVDNEGHAHLWVDGKKVTRLYATNYHLGDLSEGEHEISVTLNTNKHADYTVNGETVMDTVTVTDMHHSDDDDKSHTHGDGDDHSHDE